MARYAKLDSNNVVINVIIAEKDYIDSRPNSASYVLGEFSSESNKLFANIGMIYDVSSSAFVYAPKPYPSWILNNKFEWIPPIPYPTEIGEYEWNETTLSWSKIT